MLEMSRWPARHERQRFCIIGCNKESPELIKSSRAHVWMRHKYFIGYFYEQLADRCSKMLLSDLPL